MLLLLSTRYKKSIAFFIFYVFMLSGTASWAAAKKNEVSCEDAIKWPIERAFKKVNHSENFYPAQANLHENAETGAANMPEKSDLRIEKPENRIIKQITKDKTEEDGDPSQPEMSEFKPVGADNMVDLFTGDFSYNIPLLDVGGYPVNIFYNSGITMDQEASWVGLGWNINPGTITRNMRGLPDDFNGTDVIEKSQYSKPDVTYGVSVGARFEIFGLNTASLGLDAGIFMNNQRGLGLELGISPSIGIGAVSGDEKTAPINFGYGLKANSQTGGSQTFSMSLKQKEKNGMTGSLGGNIAYNSRVGLQSLHLDAEVSKSAKSDKTSQSMKQIYSSIHPTMGTNISFAYPSVTPSIKTRLSRQNFSLDFGTGVDAWGAYGHFRLGGYVSRTFIDDNDIVTKQPAYGLLYLQNGNEDKNALLDFNRLNDGAYTPNAPTIAIPAYTYDVFSISGEGTGGSFRAYRKDLGYVKDAFMETQSISGHLGIEIGGGAYFKGGVNANLVLSPSSAGGWETGNLAKNAMAFRKSEKDYQSVYFRNPGEKAIPDINYQKAIGEENMVRLKMGSLGVGSPTLLPTLFQYGDNRVRVSSPTTIPLTTPDIQTPKRDKRTQVISYLTAEEASRAGFNTQIPSVKASEFSQEATRVFGDNGVSGNNSGFMNFIDRYDLVKNSYRKLHHISEINVLQQDGRRYVYGIPVYNIQQTEETFNKTGGVTNQLIQYDDADKNVDISHHANSYGKDGYIEKQVTPAYAHSFLLTALLSPNYVDVTSDGITDDDMGDAIKFNYGKFDDVNWKTPVGSKLASFNEGLKTDKNDDKAHFVYGTRESWYLYSVESKNMVARFYVSKERFDSRSVISEDGNVDPNNGGQKLLKISLFSKADLAKAAENPARPAPKPIKTVHFDYDYSLCMNNPSYAEPGHPTAKGGKLRLKSLYFTYNGNEGVHKNYYRFNYSQSDATKNPSYDFTAIDRWGNYKPTDHNPTYSSTATPTKLANSDYPYVIQDKAVTDVYAAAWTMNSIDLPSGAKINVEYEADDYGYVQDRRACDMFKILGFGSSDNTNDLQNKSLYQGTSSDYDYVYIQVPKAITSNNPQKEIADLYLGNLTKSNQLFMKLSVVILQDKPRETEMIPLYADIDSYGLVSGQTDIIYIKVKKLVSGYTPMVQYSLQYMRNLLPAKAYPSSDLSGESSLTAVVKALGGLYPAFKEAFNGGLDMFKRENKCKTVDVDASFVRLTDPNIKKIGGGLRICNETIYTITGLIL